MLKLVPKSDPPPKEKIRQRVKQYARPSGMLQCNRCGSRTVMTATNGVFIKNGRKTGGTIIEKDICATCYQLGVITPMMPELVRVK